MITINGTAYPTLDAFLTALLQELAEGTTPLKLDLRGNDLHRLDASRWQALCAAIQLSPQPITLSLVWNNLNLLDVSCWQAFCAAIQTSQQPVTLDLQGNNLLQLDVLRWQALCTAIQLSQQPLTLDLRGNDLQQLDTLRQQALYTAIQLSQQPLTLNLDRNSLGKLDATCWQALCTAIQQRQQPLTLNLEGSKLSLEKITSLKEALLRSSGMHKITTGNAALDKELHKTSADKRRAFCQVFGFFKSEHDLPDDVINTIGYQVAGKFLPMKGGKTLAELAEKFADTPHVKKGAFP